MSDNLPTNGLLYNGSVIRDRGERLNLTDMWRSAGADPSRQPAEWLRSADAKRFIEFLAESLNLGNSQDGLVKVQRGGTAPTTWGHWQVALAYAKYLSPEFHAWCNTVVRERMEGKQAVAAIDYGAIGGIVKAVMIKTLDERLPAMVEQRLAVDERVTVVEYIGVRELLDIAKALPRGRRSLNARVGSALRTSALKAKTGMVGLRRCARTNVWLFPIDFARAYMKKEGNALVAAHNATVAGQSVMDFAAHKRKREVKPRGDANPNLPALVGGAIGMIIVGKEAVFYSDEYDVPHGTECVVVGDKRVKVVAMIRDDDSYDRYYRNRHGFMPFHSGDYGPDANERMEVRIIGKVVARRPLAQVGAA